MEDAFNSIHAFFNRRFSFQRIMWPINNCGTLMLRQKLLLFTGSSVCTILAWIVAEFSNIKSLKRRENVLKDEFAMLEKRMSGDRQVLPLLQRIRSMGIGIDKLQVFSVAVYEKAEKYNMSISAAAYKVIEDIENRRAE
jgi:hypothetical protein